MKSRYTAFTQQSYCCVPACLQMVMYRRELPLIEQEVLGFELGLTVPKEDIHMFNKVRTGKKPPAGWGTQISRPEFSIDKALKRLNVPLQARIHTIDYIESAQMLRKFLEDSQAAGGDTLLCFNYGKLWDKDTDSGHVCVFDRIDGDSVWIIDPGRNAPKHREVPLDKLYEAMVAHGSSKSAGAWEIY